MPEPGSRMRPPARGQPLRFPADREFEPEVVRSVAAMVATTRCWIYRRTESFRFVDLTTVERELRVEFELPPGSPTLGDTNCSIVPLAFYERDVVLRYLEATDEDGTRLSVLNKNENEKLGGEIKGVLAESAPEVLREVIGADLECGYLLCALLEHKPGMPRRQVAIRHEERLIDSKEKPLGGEEDESGTEEQGEGLTYPERSELDEKLREMIAGVREPLGSDPFARLADRRRLLDVVADRELARETMTIEAPVWFLGDVQSAHVEIEAPEELEVRDAFVAWPPEARPQGKNGGERSDPGGDAGSTDEGGEVVARFDPAVDLGPRAHLHATRAWGAADSGQAEIRKPATRRGKPALLVLGLAPRTRALRLAGAFIAGLSTFILLLGGLSIFLGVVDTPAEALVAALVFAPSVAAAIVAQPERHAIASHLLEPIRRDIAVAGVLPVAVATLLAAELPTALVGAIAVIAGLVTAWIGVSLTVGALEGDVSRQVPLPPRQGRPRAAKTGKEASASSRDRDPRPYDFKLSDISNREKPRYLPPSRRFARLLRGRPRVRSQPATPKHLRVLESTEARRRSAAANGEYRVSDELITRAARDLADEAGWGLS